MSDDNSMSASERNDVVNNPIELKIDGDTFTATPLAAYLLRETAPSLTAVRSLLGMGGDPNGTTGFHETPLKIALSRSGDPQIIRILIERGATSFDPTERFSVDLPVDGGDIDHASRRRRFLPPEPRWEKRAVDFPGLVRIVDALYHELSPDNQIECRRFIATSGKLYDGYIYLRATEEATLITSELEDRAVSGARFVELTGLLLSGRHPREATTLIGQIEDLMDNHEEVNHWHPAEPELALLLGHPALDYTSAEDIETTNIISRALTGIHRLYYRGIQTINPNVVQTIADLGFITHSFRFFRFESERQREWLNREACPIPNSSLLEKFGFERIPPRASDRSSDGLSDHFGIGYVIRPRSDILTSGSLARNPHLDPDFHIEFRRAYIVANHPKYGTLLVRNSSPAFGRDKFEHFAYWGPTPAHRMNTTEDLLFPENLIQSKQLRPALSAEGPNYKNVAVGMIQSQCVHHLAKGIIAVKDGIRRWKFNTDADSAWDIDPVSGARYPSGSGMHLSDGFPAVVSFLTDRMKFIQQAQKYGLEHREKMPDLAFYHPYLPAWRAEDFEAPLRPGGREMLRSRLPISPDVLQGLQKLARRETRASDMAALRSCGLTQFLIAGAAAQAELTLISPSDDENAIER